MYTDPFSWGLHRVWGQYVICSSFQLYEAESHSVLIARPMTLQGSVPSPPRRLAQVCFD